MKYRRSIQIWMKKQIQKSKLVSMTCPVGRGNRSNKNRIHSLEIDINSRKKDHERFEDESEQIEAKNCRFGI